MTNQIKHTRVKPSMTEAICWLMITFGVGSLIAAFVLDMMGLLIHE